MSVLILSLFNGILLFRQRTEQSVLYHVCPDAEGLGGTLNSALLKVGLAKKEMPCRLLVVFREIQCVSRSQCRLLNFIQFSASDGEGNGGVIQHILKGTVPSHIEIPFQNSIGSLPDFRRQPLELSRIEFAGRFNLRDFFKFLGIRQQFIEIGKRLFMNIHITVTHDGQQPVNVMVLPADGNLRILIEMPVGGEFYKIPGCRFHRMVA